MEIANNSAKQQTTITTIIINQTAGMNWSTGRTLCTNSNFIYLRG